MGLRAPQGRRGGFGGTVNDVVFAMCGGALRAYLEDINQLPERSLVAMVPISLRRPDSTSPHEGNAFGSILCDLRTDSDDPGSRYQSIVHSQTSEATFRAALP